MWGKQKETGFTVIEIVVSLVVGGMIILSLTILISSLAIANDRAKDLTLANALAENKLETLRSQGYTALTDGTTDFTAEMPTTITGPRSATYVISEPTVGIKRVDLTITYEDRGSTKTLAYSTFVGQLGVAQ